MNTGKGQSHLSLQEVRYGTGKYQQPDRTDPAYAPCSEAHKPAPGKQTDNRTCKETDNQDPDYANHRSALRQE